MAGIGAECVSYKLYKAMPLSYYIARIKTDENHKCFARVPEAVEVGPKAQAMLKPSAASC